MKNWKKAAVLLLVLLSGLMFTGCGAFQTQMTKTAARMSRLANFHTDVDARLGALMNIGGQKIRIEATVSGGFDTETDPLLIRTDLRLETFGVERELRYFIQKDNDTWSVYPRGEERLANEAGSEQQTSKRPGTAQFLKLLIKCGDWFADPVDDIINGAHARRYDGLIPDEYVDEALTLLDLKEEEDTDRPEAAVIIPEGQEETGTAGEENPTEPGAETPEEEPAGLPVSIWINDDDMIVQADIDLAVFLRKLMDESLEKLLTEYGMEDLELKGKLQYADTRLTFSAFDALEPLRLPDA